MTDALDPRAQLLEKEERLVRRLGAIRADRRRENAPLSADFADQAIERENDETLDGLDEAGRAELAAIRKALARLEAGSYETCTDCGNKIRPERLAALPETAICASCAGVSR